MKISLDGFEYQIEEKILKRGLDYFKRGYVTDAEELGGGDYEFIVEGSETYTVNLSVEGNTVTDFGCDCPYDMGPICKHVVAALFYLQRDALKTIELPAKRMQSKPKEKSVARQLEELLKTLSHDDLKVFIHDTCMGDSKFRQLFVAKHIHLLYPESKELYVKQLKALIKTYSDKHGFVGYRDAGRLSCMVSGMAEEAMDSLAKGEFQKSMFIALAIIEEMTYLISYGVDDSGGDIGGNIEEAFNVLDALVDLKLNKVQHDELFDNLLALFEKGSLKGWDWHFNVIALGIKLLRTEQEKERIKSALDKIKPSGKNWDWDYRRSQELMLNLIRKTENGEVADQFIENNLSNPQFRTELIRKSLEVKDYIKAERLAQEGITIDEKDAPGLAEDWRNYLLTIYLQTEDIKNTIKLTRYFLIQSNGRHHPLKYFYDLLKSLIPEDQWGDYLESLIADIRKRSKWLDYERIAQLYIWEAYWDRLFELLQQNSSFERIASAEQYLGASYSDKLAALYRDFILDYLELNVGRNYYQTACRYIRRMIKMGARPMAADLIEKLKILYPTRRALLEELSNI